jgi:hypothetical protein
MKRLTLDGSVLQIPRTKDQHYLYTLNPPLINPKSNKVEHQLKILDLYIHLNCPSNYKVEPLLGSYAPDFMYKDKNNQTICCEIQLTPISKKKMQQKINHYSNEYNVKHDSRILHLYSDYDYKDINAPKNVHIIKKRIVPEIVL